MQTILAERRGIRRLTTVRTVADALAFLNREAPYEDAERPNLILLDMHLPDGSGLDLLDTIKRSPNLRPIPVVVISGVATEEQQQRVYDSHASAYVHKPDDLEAFEQALRRMEAFYLDMVKLPS